jgi:hydroxymethylpyrimidine/phosphomethylpyrimidine kinase
VTICNALTIAGSDPSGGAGIQADLKAFAASGVHGLSVITALTAQNSTGVQAIWPSTAESIALQLQSLTEDLTIHAVKTGMLASADAISLIASALPHCPLVIDPVLRVTHGASHSSAEIEAAVRTILWPKATLVTPNAPEAERLLGQRIENASDMLAAARALLDCGLPAVYLKGGHVEIEASHARDLLLLSGSDPIWFSAPRIAKKTHGTGCVLSALITAELAKGADLLAACRQAHQQFQRYLAAGEPAGLAQRVSPDPFAPSYVRR